MTCYGGLIDIGQWQSSTNEAAVMRLRFVWCARDPAAARAVVASMLHRGTRSALEAGHFALEAAGFALKAARCALEAECFPLKAAGSALKAALFPVKAAGFALEAPRFVPKAAGFAFKAPRFARKAAHSAVRLPYFAVKAATLAACSAAAGAAVELTVLGPARVELAAPGAGLGPLAESSPSDVRWHRAGSTDD